MTTCNEDVLFDARGSRDSARLPFQISSSLVLRRNRRIYQRGRVSFHPERKKEKKNTLSLTFHGRLPFDFDGRFFALRGCVKED